MKKRLLILILAVAGMATLILSLGPWSRREGLIWYRVKETLRHGAILQTVADELKNALGRPPTVEEIQTTARLVERPLEEFFSDIAHPQGNPHRKNRQRISTFAEAEGGWHYDQESGRITINVTNEVQISSGMRIVPASVRFNPLPEHSELAKDQDSFVQLTNFISGFVEMTQEVVRSSMKKPE